VRHLRLANAAAAGCVFAAAAAAGRRLHPRASYAGVAAAAALLALLPTHSLYTWLYYTDAPGLACLLGCWAASLAGRPVSTALAATAAILCRQTNAVWVAFIAGDALLRAAAAAVPLEARWTGRKGVAGQVAALATTLASTRGRPLASLIPCALPCAAFAVAVAMNGGVALGDKGNHAVAAHWAQAPLAALAAAAALAPAHATRAHVSSMRAELRSPAGPRRAALFSALAYAAAATARAHPFLLADNRHYTFYAWRALQRLPAAARPAAVGLPAAAAAAWLATALADARAPALWTAGLAAATLLAVVPSPLIEPRYFTPAIAFAALRLGPPRRPVLGLALHAAGTAAVAYVFLARPFVQDGELKRFMW
jgi:alpha-1,2-glucosyltransferase